VVLALAFGVTEVIVLHIQVRREAQTVSLSEAVTVLALFFASPAALVLSRALAGLVVCLVHRRSSPLKTAFNVALFAAEAAVATHVFAALASPQGSFDPQSWLAAAIAILVSCGVGIFALQAVVAVYEGGFSFRSALRESLVGQVLSPLVTTIALVGVLCLSSDTRSAWLLVIPASGLLLGYRAYARLSDRHLSLERLYRFSQVVTSSPEIDAVLRSVLAEAKELLRAEHVVVDFLPAKPDDPSLQVRLGADGVLLRTEVDGRQHPDWLHHLVVVDAGSLLAARGSRVHRWAEWLASEGHREVIVVPLRGEAGVIGTLRVSDRMGEVRAFDANDVLLLETVANHAGISLQNGRLVDQLRHDALHDALTGLPTGCNSSAPSLKRRRRWRTVGGPVPRSWSLTSTASSTSTTRSGTAAETSCSRCCRTASSQPSDRSAWWPGSAVTSSRSSCPGRPRRQRSWPRAVASSGPSPSRSTSTAFP